MEGTTVGKKKNVEYIAKLELLIRAVTSDKVGVILVGQPLSGKSTLIDLAAEFLRTEQKEQLKVHRIYHNAYTSQEVFENDKNTTILTESINDLTSTNWMVFDGKISG